MVLHWRRCGRAGGRQIKKIKHKSFQIERACAKSYANLNQQGSAVAILLVLPVIRVHKRLWVLMTDKTSVRDVEDVRITSEPHKQSLFGHDTDVSSIKNQIQAYGSKLPTLVCDFSFGCKLYLENCIHENISKRKEFINLNEHVKIETSSNIREYVTRDTSSIWYF